MTEKQLNRILGLLRKHGVSSYKVGDLEIRFSERAMLKDPLVDNVSSAKDIPSKTPEEIDEETLYWSADPN